MHARTAEVKSSEQVVEPRQAGQKSGPVTEAQHMWWETLTPDQAEEARILLDGLCAALGESGHGDSNDASCSCGGDITDPLAAKRKLPTPQHCRSLRRAYANNQQDPLHRYSSPWFGLRWQRSHTDY